MNAFSHVEIWGGIVTREFAIAAGDPVVDPLPRYRFFVDVVGEDGSRLGLWHGTDYLAAIREAETTTRALHLDRAVRDVVGGAP